MGSSSDPSERQPSREATLYCSDCDHARLINGDWIIHVRAESLDYECPECGTTTDSRRDRSDLATRSRGALRFGGAR